MTHPPELMIYLAPGAVFAALMAAIGRQTDSTVAWCLAAAGVTLCIAIIGSWVNDARPTPVVHPSPEKIDELMRDAKRLSRFQPEPPFGIFGPLHREFLLQEYITARNVEKHFGEREGSPS